MAFKKLPELLTIRDVTHILHVHPNTLRNWERAGVLEVIRLGARRDRRYKKEIILKLLQNKVNV